MRSLSSIISYFTSMLAGMIASIYDFCVAYPLTNSIYRHFGKLMQDHFGKEEVSMVDIGTGTGTPLKSLLPMLNFNRVLAIDINDHYINTAKKNLKQHENVDVQFQDFLEMDPQNEKFDIVFFGFSFMLIPDKVRALQIARQMVKPGGKIAMFLTLYQKKNRFVEFVKPKLEYISSIEFGQVYYYDQMKEILNDGGVKIVYEEKLGIDVSPVLGLFNIYLFEVEAN